MKRIGIVLRLIATFFYDLFASSVAVAKVVISGGDRAQSAIVRVPVDLKTDWGVALFASLTSLTPGSTCLYVSRDRHYLYVHMLDAPSDDVAIARFKRLYEQPIRELEA